MLINRAYCPYCHSVMTDSDICDRCEDIAVSDEYADIDMFNENVRATMTIDIDDDYKIYAYGRMFAPVCIIENIIPNWREFYEEEY